MFLRSLGKLSEFHFLPLLRGFPPFKRHALIQFQKKQKTKTPQKQKQKQKATLVRTGRTLGGHRERTETVTSAPGGPGLPPRQEGNQTQARGESSAAQSTSSPSPSSLLPENLPGLEAQRDSVILFFFKSQGAVEDITHAVGAHYMFIFFLL